MHAQYHVKREAVLTNTYIWHLPWRAMKNQSIAKIGAIRPILADKTGPLANFGLPSQDLNSKQ